MLVEKKKIKLFLFIDDMIAYEKAFYRINNKKIPGIKT